jgi:hypothetical protein
MVADVIKSLFLDRVCQFTSGFLTSRKEDYKGGAVVAIWIYV